MSTVVKLPQFGQTMDEGTIVACLVNLGDLVRRGDVLFDIETDKATVEMESPADGYVKQIMARMGQSYRLGTPLLILGEKDEQVSAWHELPAREDTAKGLPQAQPANVPTPVPVVPREINPPDARRIKLGQTIPVNRLQRITAQKMLRSKREIPSFYLTVRADVTELVAYRTRFNETGEVKVAYSDFIIKAAASGLQRFPLMTGQIDAEGIRLAGSIGVGLAIAVPEGLVAPIVKDPDKKTVVEIARCTRQLADKTRNNQLTPEDLEGGCITVSNLGALGIDSFIPIVVPGQCSILGIGRIKDACVPDVGSTSSPQDGNINPPYVGRVNIRKIMNMTLSVDHRIANGAYASQFLDFVKKTLEDLANFG